MPRNTSLSLLLINNKMYVIKSILRGMIMLNIYSIYKMFEKKTLIKFTPFEKEDYYYY